MKAVVLFLVLFSAPIYISFFHLEKIIQFYPLNQLPLYIANMSDQSVFLYSAKNPKGNSVGHLSSGDVILYKYSGGSGSWWYGIKNNEEVLLKNDEKEFAFKLGQIVFPFTYIPWGVSFLSLILPFIYILRRLNSIKFAKKFDLFGKHRLQEEIAGLQQRILNLESENSRLYQQKVSALNRENNAEIKISIMECENKKLKIANDKYQTLTEQFNEREKRNIKEKETSIKEARERKNKQQAEREKALYKEIAILRTKFEQKKAQWLEKVNHESERRTNVHIEQMQASYDLLYTSYVDLKSEYDQIKKDGLVFDIDFDSEKYEGMLKGRKFEIFFAQNMMQTNEIEILEWTSDKGNESDLYVASNGNPDFVFQYRKKIKFAVECKYRGVYFTDHRNKRETIQWANVEQAKRYRQFENERGIPVFVALGFLGEASNPDITYLLPLQSLSIKTYEYEISTSDKPLLLLTPESVSSYSVDKEQLKENLLRQFMSIE